MTFEGMTAAQIGMSLLPLLISAAGAAIFLAALYLVVRAAVTAGIRRVAPATITPPRA